jgi:hypothetical protein
MGFHVYPDTSQAAGVRMLDWKWFCGGPEIDLSAHEALGNSMCVPTVGVAILVCLTCASKLSAEEQESARNKISITMLPQFRTKQIGVAEVKPEILFKSSEVAVDKTFGMPTATAKIVATGDVFVADSNMGKFVASKAPFCYLLGVREDFKKKVHKNIARSKAIFIPDATIDVSSLQAISVSMLFRLVYRCVHDN